MLDPRIVRLVVFVVILLAVGALLATAGSAVAQSPWKLKIMMPDEERKRAADD